MMTDFDKLSATGKAFIALFVSYAAVLIAAVWGGFLEQAVFWKISFTYAIVTVVLAAVYLVRREFIDDEKAKKDKFMD